MARLYIKTPWSYETDSWVDVTSVNFNSKKIHEDENFRLTKYITIFLRSIQTLQMCKIPKHEIGTLMVHPRKYSVIFSRMHFVTFVCI